jgi:hypothetical protein
MASEEGGAGDFLCMDLLKKYGWVIVIKFS